MLTDRDMCMAAFHQGRTLHEILIAVAMSKIVFSVRPGHTAKLSVARADTVSQR